MAGIETKGPISTQDWMGELRDQIGDEPLTRIKMPGAHDAATASIGYKSKIGHDVGELYKRKHYFSPVEVAKKPIADWSRAQNISVGKQLEAGVRYFDFRVDKLDNGSFAGVHGLVGDQYEDVFKEIASFLKEHPNEVIIMDFQHFHNMRDIEAKQAFFALLDKHLGEKLIPQPEDGHIPTFNDVLETKGRIMAFYPGRLEFIKEKIHPNLWSRNQKLNSDWKNKSDVEDLVEDLKREYSYKENPLRFHVMQAVTTPKLDSIKASYMPDNILKKGVKKIINVVSRLFREKPLIQTKNVPIGLRNAAKNTNRAILDFVRDFKKEGDKQDINIVMVDHVQDAPDLVQEILRKNLQS